MHFKDTPPRGTGSVKSYQEGQSPLKGEEPHHARVAKCKESSKIKPFASKREELSMEDDVILWGSRVVIPDNMEMRTRILEELHSTHLGIVQRQSQSKQGQWTLWSIVSLPGRICGRWKEAVLASSSEPPTMFFPHPRT